MAYARKNHKVGRPRLAVSALQSGPAVGAMSGSRRLPAEALDDAQSREREYARCNLAC